MGLSRRSIELFIADSLSLARKGVTALKQMESSPSPEEVRKFFHAVHSLKGTASMVPHSSEVVAPLHQLEARLTLGGSFEALAQSYIEWRDEALMALEKAIYGLKALHRALETTAKSTSSQEGNSSSSLVKFLDDEEFCYLLAAKLEGGVEHEFYIPVREIVATESEEKLGQTEEAVLSREGRWWRVISVRGVSALPNSGESQRLLLWVRSDNPFLERVFRLEAGSRVAGILTVRDARNRAIPHWQRWVEVEPEKIAA
jgi:chemotaxis protein histidine kinase CheA